MWYKSLLIGVGIRVKFCRCKELWIAETSRNLSHCDVTGCSTIQWSNQNSSFPRISISVASHHLLEFPQTSLYSLLPFCITCTFLVFHFHHFDHGSPTSRGSIFLRLQPLDHKLGRTSNLLWFFYQSTLQYLFSGSNTAGGEEENPSHRIFRCIALALLSFRRQFALRHKACDYSRLDPVLSVYCTQRTRH